MHPLGRFGMLSAFFVVGCLPDDPTSGGGCGLVFEDPLAAITVDNARLENVTLWQAGLLGGRTEGRVDLVVEDTDGNVFNFPAVLEGSHAGLVADASINVTGDAVYPLALPATPVTARALLGTYEGPHVGIDVVAGFHWRELTNGSAVRLNVTTLTFGIGFVPVTWERVGLQLLDDPGGFTGGGDDGDDGDDDGDDCELFGDCDCVDDGFCDDACFDDPDCDCTNDGVCDPECFDDDVCPVALLGEQCTRDVDPQGSCADDLVCVRAREDELFGRCRQSCVDTCDGTSTCQVATSAPLGAIEGTACLERAAADALCGALLDDDACVDGFACRGAGVFPPAFVEQRCKEICGVDDPCTDPTETCLPDGGGALTCGVTVAPPTDLAQFPTLLEDDVCNDLDGRRYCDQSMFAGAAEPGTAVCLSLGFCFPLCSEPIADRDNDGLVEDVAVLECGTGFACTTELALATSIVETLVDATGGNRVCDSALCLPGAPCEACGPGDVTCAADVCIAPFKSCAPVP